MAKKKNNRVKSSESELKDKLVSLNRVAKVTKGGRTFSFAALVVVGDGNGTVGYGLGKAREVAAAITKATEDAKKSLIKVPIYKGTIPHTQNGKFGAGKVLIIASEKTAIILPTTSNVMPKPTDIFCIVTPCPQIKNASIEQFV